MFLNRIRGFTVHLILKKDPELGSDESFLHSYTEFSIEIRKFIIRPCFSCLDLEKSYSLVIRGFAELDND